jgi:hypothetical protein
MAEPERGNALADPVITGADSHNTASVSTEPGLAVTTNRVDGTAAGQSPLGIVPPRATTAELNHRYVEGGTQPVITTERVARTVTFGQTAQHGADPREQERLRTLIAQATIDLNALTTGDRGNRGDNNTVPESMIDTLLARAPANEPGGSILLNGLRERPTVRTVPQVPVPPYPHAEQERPLNVSGICAMAKDQKYHGTVSGEKSTKHQKKFNAFKFNVKTAIAQFKHSDTARLENMCALMHLDGDAKDLVVEWSIKNGREANMARIFSLLEEQCKMVELDVMDIAAEVEATTAHTVAMAIQREVGPSGQVSIQTVMRGLNNAIAMRDGLLQGEGKFDLISRCKFLLAAFTPTEGVAGREWMLKMREQARWTLDDSNLRKCQMDPEKMIEQLTACGDWWDKYAKHLSTKRGGDDQPFTQVQQKKHKGTSERPSGSGYGTGGPRDNSRQERGRPEHRSDNRGDSRGSRDDRGRTPAPDTRRVNFETDRPKEDEDPFKNKSYHTSPVYLPKHSIWAIDSSPAKRAALSTEGKCFLCKEKGHSARDCKQMEKLYADRKACYYQRK